MKNWKYLKGSESDFIGAHAGDTHKYLHKECKHPVYTAKPEIIKEVLFDLVAIREPITDEDDLNECIGATESITMNGKPLSELIGVEYATFNSAQFGIPSFDYCDNEKVGELHADGEWHSADLGESGGIEALIADRGNRYGKFKDGAAIMQELKFIMREVDGWNDLTPSQKEALDMIQHKVGRILNGDPNYDDSWKDIAGYATLIVNELNGEIK